jgi:hypothetical protein
MTVLQMLAQWVQAMHKVQIRFATIEIGNLQCCRVLITCLSYALRLRLLPVRLCLCVLHPSVWARWRLLQRTWICIYIYIYIEILQYSNLSNIFCRSISLYTDWSIYLIIKLCSYPACARDRFFLRQSSCTSITDGSLDLVRWLKNSSRIVKTQYALITKGRCS